MRTPSINKADTTSVRKIAQKTEYQLHEVLDLRGVKCPMNMVRVKLALEQIEDGATLRVIIDTGEPMRSIPRAAKEEGHKIVEAGKLDGDGFSLLIEKNGGS